MTPNPSKQLSVAAKLDRAFYARGAEAVAQDLIGKILVHRIGRKRLRARIIETEAYLGEHDLASHANRGRTARTDVMFGEAGHAYVYFIYGMHEMLNVVCAPVGDAQAVLIRAAEPLDNWEVSLIGPGRLTRAMQINRKLNRIDLTGKTLWFESDGSPVPPLSTTRRIGVDYAGDWKHSLLRYIDSTSPAAPKLVRQANWPKNSDEAMPGKPKSPVR